MNNKVNCKCFRIGAQCGTQRMIRTLTHKKQKMWPHGRRAGCMQVWRQMGHSKAAVAGLATPAAAAPVVGAVAGSVLIDEPSGAVNKSFSITCRICLHLFAIIGFGFVLPAAAAAMLEVFSESPAAAAAAAAEVDGETQRSIGCMGGRTVHTYCMSSSSSSLSSRFTMRCELLVLGSELLLLLALSLPLVARCCDMFSQILHNRNTHNRLGVCTTRQNKMIFFLRCCCCSL